MFNINSALFIYQKEVSEQGGYVMYPVLPYKNSLHSINPYIPGKRLEEVVKELGLREVIKLASNENPLGCSPGPGSGGGCTASPFPLSGRGQLGAKG